jgi:hypothetical protein
MTVQVAVGLALALASAAALNWGFVVQHGAAAALPPLSIRRPLRSLRALFDSPRWLAGFVTGIGGWGLYVGALALAPLSLVQATAAGGIGLLAIFAWRASGERPNRHELGGVVLASAGLALLGASLVGASRTSTHGSWASVAVWIGVSVVAAAVAVAVGARVLRSGSGLGLAAGLLYAAGDVATKAAVVGGTRLAFVPAVLACHGLAFVALQMGFQRGAALATAGVATLCTNALPIVAGTTAFGEGLPTGWAGALRVLAFVAVVAGAAALARPGGGRPGVSRDGRRSVAPRPRAPAGSSQFAAQP